jgi:hypothetical protein
LSKPSSRELWNRVVALEKTCRNSSPTILSKPSSDGLVQLQSSFSASGDAGRIFGT